MTEYGQNIKSAVSEIKQRQHPRTHAAGTRRHKRYLAKGNYHCSDGGAHLWDIDEKNHGVCRKCLAERQFSHELV